MSETRGEMLAVKREQNRVARVLSDVATERCSCGGSGPHDPECCEACAFYHDMLGRLGIDPA